jgi:predicted metal-binding protein
MSTAAPRGVRRGTDRAEIVACETCGGAEVEADGRTRGAHLIDRLRSALAARGDADVDVNTVRCLWACKRSCAVLLRSASRVAYVIVDLPPDDVSAQALLDYAQQYLQTEDGAVPLRLRPRPLSGHFLCRLPRTHQPPPAAFENEGGPIEDPTS